MGRRPARKLPPHGLPAGALPLLDHVPLYARKWHAVEDWASDTLEPSDVRPSTFKPSPTQAGWVGQWVSDLDDESEAITRGIQLERLGPRLLRGPSRDKGGYRRVVIHAYTWAIEHFGGPAVALDPSWITLGWGFSAEQAWSRAQQFIRAYGQAAKVGRASRILKATALEIVWWTAGPTTDYV